MSQSFPAHTIETAPDEVRPALEAMQLKMGFIPSMLAKFAEAPPLLMGCQTLVPFFDKSTLDPANALARTPPNPEFGDALWHRRS